jgi:hypothetical protein
MTDTRSGDTPGGFDENRDYPTFDSGREYPTFDGARDYPTMTTSAPSAGRSGPNPPGPGKLDPKLIIAAVAGLCVLAVVAVIAIQLWPRTASSDEQPVAAAENGTVTRCDTAPELTPEQITTTPGGLLVRVRAVATCAGGDVLSGVQTEVNVRDGGDVVAAGLFDFSGAPVAIAGGDESGTAVELVFPAGSFFRLPDTIDTGGLSVEVVSATAGAVADSAPAPDANAAASSVVAVAPAPVAADAVLTAGDALRRQATADRTFILANLDNRWVAQLSSKRPGLVAEDRTWSEQAILDEFLALRLRFGDARLLFSNEWPVFDYRGWWVTVATPTFGGPDAANNWCRQQGFDRDHCFAKRISTTAGPEGSTRYWG